VERLASLKGPPRGRSQSRPGIRAIGYPVAQLKAAHAIAELIDFLDGIRIGGRRRIVFG